MRLLALTHRLPYAPNRGDRIRAYYMLRELTRAFDVELLSLVHDEAEAAHANDLAALGIQTTVAPVPYWRNRLRGGVGLIGRRPLTHFLLSSPDVRTSLRRIVAERKPDVVFAYCSGMAQYVLSDPLIYLPFVLDLVDVDSAKWQALSQRTSWPKRAIYSREQRTLSAFERRAAEAAANTLVVNERERQLLSPIAPRARITVVPNGVDVDSFRPPGPPATAPVAAFCGVMSYGPNEQGAVWLAKEVWPLVVREVPAARLFLVGAEPTTAVTALASSSITVTGSVPDTRPYLWDAAVGVAPLHTARGIQNKVLEAAAAGLPSVVTTAVAEGLPATVRTACAVADEAEPFAREIIALFQMTAAERRALAVRGTRDTLSWAQRLAGLNELFAEAATTRRASRSGR